MLAKANQALATLDKYRSRLDQVSTRLTALEFEGGVTLHDVLTVLQRAELVTRMAVEIERYIVELGADGRLIEMQLEETMVGVAADKSALVRDYIVEPSEEALRDGPRLAGPAAASRPARLRATGRAARLRPQAQHPRPSRLPARLPHPGAHPAPAQDGGSVDRGRVRTGWTRSSPPPIRSWKPSRAWATCVRRTSARAFAVCRRSTSWTAICKRETTDGAVYRDV